jgi:hypothetical protein
MGSCEDSNEPLGSIKGRQFLDQLGDYQLLKKESVCLFVSQLELT